MSVYKVPQDVESEDKLIGPLTFRKTAFAGVGFAALATAWFMGRIPPQPFFGVIPLPIAAVFLILAFYPSKDQPVEIILAAKIRFMIKPRLRIWDQRGIKQLVVITVPRKEHKQLTKGYSENEVSSRLQALAKTLDSRGWATKNVNLNTFSQPAYATGPSDQRLISPTILPQATPPAGLDVKPADDILDHTSNPIAQHFDTMMTRAAEEQRRVAIDRMQQAAQQPLFQIPNPAPIIRAEDIESMPEPEQQPRQQYVRAARHAVNNPDNAGFATFGATTIQTPAEVFTTEPQAVSADEEALLEKIHKQQDSGTHTASKMKRIKTPKEVEAEEKRHKHDNEPKKSGSHKAAEHEKPHASNQTDKTTEASLPEPDGAKTSPDASNPAILELANNDDLNIATLARQAQAKTGDLEDGEVVISLR